MAINKLRSSWQIKNRKVVDRVSGILSERV